MSSSQTAIVLSVMLCSLSFADGVVYDDWAWARGFGSTRQDYAQAMAVDNQDNVWVGGVSHHDTLVIGDDTLVGTGSRHGYLAKYDGVSGDPITAVPIEGARATVQCIAIRPNGHLVIAGEYRGTITFGITQVTSYQGDDIFVAEYDSENGIWIWAGTAIGTGDDFATDVAVDGDGNVYIAGTFEGSLDFDPVSVASPFTSFDLASSGGDPNGQTDAFLAKYTHDGGGWEWAVQVGGDDQLEDDWGLAVCLSADGNVLLGGSLGADEVSFGEDTTINGAGGDFFLAEFGNVDATIMRILIEGGDGGEEISEIALDNFGNIVVGGEHTSGDNTFSLGGTVLNTDNHTNLFVAKYNITTEDWEWAAQGGHPQAFDYLRGMDVDGEGNVVVAGELYHSGTFGSIPYASQSYHEVFAARFSPGRNDWDWLLLADGDGWNWASDIVVSPSGALFLAGSFQNAIAFDTDTLHVRGTTYDAFVARIGDIAPSLRLDTPDGGEVLSVGQAAAIEWTARFVSSIRIDFSDDNGATWELVADAADPHSAYSWTPTVATTQGLIRIRSAEDSTLGDSSSAVFTVENNNGALPAAVAAYTNALLGAGHDRRSATIVTDFSLATPGPVSLVLYSLNGERIRAFTAQSLSPGSHRVSFDAADLARGAYVLQLRLPNSAFVKHRQVITAR
ncbi:MAG: hypothetical protein GF331_26690 [Chitinivibrionales bacterium]|nr:hypothetical protein [Chitinivibrionales bacterium]